MARLSSAILFRVTNAVRIRRPGRGLGLRALFIALAVFFGAVVGIEAQTGARAAELVMFEEAGCGWCKRWNEEIGVVYHRTREGRMAPLRRVDVHDRRPADLAHIRFVNFTPTFVLVENGREYGRILGYPGEDFFWPLLNEILAKLPANDPSAAPAPRPQPIRLAP